MPDVFSEKLEMEQTFIKPAVWLPLGRKWLILLSCHPLPQHPTSKWTEIWELRRAYSGTRHLHPSGKSSERANLTLARAKMSDSQDAFNIPSSVCSLLPPTENIPKMIISLNLHESLVVGGGNTTGWHFALEPVNIRRGFLVGAPTGKLFSSSAVAPTSPNCKTCCTKYKPADRRKRTYYMKDEIIM